MCDWKLPKRQRRWEARLRGMPYRSSVSDQPHYVKMYFITQFLPDSTRESVYPMRALQLAAVEIQRTARGRGLRQRFKNMDWDSMSPEQRVYTARQLSRPPRLEVSIPPKPTPNAMLSKYLHFVKSRELAHVELPSFASGGFAVWCASRIQSWWRMIKQKWRFTLLRFRMYHIASQQIQFVVKSYLYVDSPEIDPSRPTKAQSGRMYEKVAKFIDSPKDEAAYIIQSLWWRHANQRVYKYFRDLIQFRLCGNPASLLRTINPREASLFDKATGIHVRFRLGGSSFPPTLFYKVFLLNPLCDVGSFAPRDYAYASKKAIVVNKYQNNSLTSKFYDGGFKSTDTDNRRTNTSFNGRVSSSKSAVDTPTGRTTSGRNVVSLKFSQEGAPSPGSHSNNHSTGRRTFSRDVRSYPNYSGASGSRSGQQSEVSNSSRRQYEETKRKASETNSLGQIRVGTSYFGTTIEHIGPEGTDNWYRREENNGWRPVSGSKAEAASGESAPRGAFKEEPNKPMTFHYSRVKRKELKEKHRKEKKREWLLSMYRDGLAREKEVDEIDENGEENNYYFDESNGTKANHRDQRKKNNSRPSNAYSNFYNGKNSNNNEGVNEVDNNISEYVFSAHDLNDQDDGFDLLDEEILTWSKNLDYDDYVANWHTLATSGTSGNNYHVPTNQKNAHDIVPEPDWVALKKQFE